MSAENDEKRSAERGERKAHRAVCRRCGAQAYFTDEIFPETCSFCRGKLGYRSEKLSSVDDRGGLDAPIGELRKRSVSEAIAPPSWRWKSENGNVRHSCPP